MGFCRPSPPRSFVSRHPTSASSTRSSPKLAAYRASGAKLTPDAIGELLAGGREDEIFKLTDNLLPHPTPQALQIARGLTPGGFQPTSVAYRMARHVALVLEVRARQERGETLQFMQAEMT